MDANSEIRYLGDVQRLELKPDDVLVLTVDDKYLSAEAVTGIRERLEAVFPEKKNKILVLAGNVKIGVLAQ